MNAFNKIDCTQCNNYSWFVFGCLVFHWHPTKITMTFNLDVVKMNWNNSYKSLPRRTALTSLHCFQSWRHTPDLSALVSLKRNVSALPAWDANHGVTRKICWL